MSDAPPKETLQAAMNALSPEHIDDSQHPSADELFAYHIGDLSEEDGRQIRTHITWCPECSRTVLDLASWPEVELHDPSMERTEDEEASDWQAIRSRRIADPPPQPVPQSSLRQSSFSLVHLAAAALLIATIGLSLQVTLLTGRLAEVTGLTANVFVTDVEPVDAASTRGGEEVQRIRVPANMEAVVLLLVQNDFRPFDRYSAEVHDGEGRISWKAERLASPPEGGFSIEIPLDAVASNEVKIRLFGNTGQQREHLSTYRVYIELDAD
jgi:hypothetical protein